MRSALDAGIVLATLTEAIAGTVLSLGRGCSTANPGHGSSRALFRWPWWRPVFCFTCVFSQGSRWDWFEEARIPWLTVIGADLTAGRRAVIERLTTTTAMLTAKGMDAAATSRAATSLLDRAVTAQSSAIAFDTAFNAVALLIVFAAPMLVGIKIGVARYAKVRAALLSFGP